MGFITFWRDSLLIVAGQPDHAAILRRNAMWKESKGYPPFTSGANHVKYLGIETRQGGGKWEWRHATENRVGWEDDQMRAGNVDQTRSDARNPNLGLDGLRGAIRFTRTRTEGRIGGSKFIDKE